MNGNIDGNHIIRPVIISIKASMGIPTISATIIQSYLPNFGLSFLNPKVQSISSMASLIIFNANLRLNSMFESPLPFTNLSSIK